MKPLPFVINPNPNPEGYMPANKDERALARKRALDLYERRQIENELKEMGIDPHDLELWEAMQK